MGLVAVMVMAPTRERKRLWWLPWEWASCRLKFVPPVVALMRCLMSFAFWPLSMCHNNVPRDHIPELTIMVQRIYSTVYQLHCAFVQAEIAGCLI